jgi:hypothetical protein
MIDRLLFRHPREVGESYGEHAADCGTLRVYDDHGRPQVPRSLRFCPGVQQRAASDTVDRLHHQLQQRRAASSVDHDYVI